MTVYPATTPEFSAFDGRMAQWRNDDLLLSETQRELIDAEFPRALAVFDFPSCGRYSRASTAKPAGAGDGASEPVWP